MREERTGKLDPGTVIFLSGFPVYGVVVDRQSWLKEVEKIDHEEASEFWEREKKLKMIPFLILGSYIGTRVLRKDGSVFMRKYVQRWGSNNFGAHISFIRSPEEFLQILRQGFHFHGSRYLREVCSELEVLIDYLKNPSLKKGPGDASFELWNIFQKAIPQ
jgi:hypothetical protein